MIKKVKKYLKFIVCCALIVSLIAPSYAALSASDGSAFVTKAEFDAAMADFNSRLTTFEAGINSKIDSQVTSYLDRNGIWNGKAQTLTGTSDTGFDWWCPFGEWNDYNTSFSIPNFHNQMKNKIFDYVWDSGKTFTMNKSGLAVVCFFNKGNYGFACQYYNHDTMSAYSTGSTYGGGSVSADFVSSGIVKNSITLTSLSYDSFLQNKSENYWYTLMQGSFPASSWSTNFFVKKDDVVSVQISAHGGVYRGTNWDNSNGYGQRPRFGVSSFDVY